MSFAEDNGIDDYSMIDELNNIELLWQKGIHKDKNGNEWKISEMETRHLKNTINYFNMFDTKPLKRELKKRYESRKTKNKLKT